MTQEASHPDQLVLSGELVVLQPLQQQHAQALVAAASDGRLWEMKLTVIPGPDTVHQYIATALAGRQAGTVLPFVIVDHRSGEIVGSTRFWKIDAANRKMEIGHTWLSASMQRSGINTEAKYLLLCHALRQCRQCAYSSQPMN